MADTPAFPSALIRKWTNLSLRTKALLVFALPSLALLVSATLIVRLAQEKTRAEDHKSKALDMRAQLQNMYIVLLSAESEIRNYGLNGREDGLQPFGLASASADVLFTRLKDLMLDNPGQVGHLERIQVLVHSRLAGLKELREFYHSSTVRGAEAPVELRARARISPDVLLEFNDMANSETKLIVDRAKADAAKQARLLSWIVISAAIGFLGGIIAVLLLSRSIAQRMQRLERNAFRMAEGLPSDAPWEGTDELGRLASAIEKAGGVIAARSEELKLALEGAELLIWDLDPDSGRIRYHAGTGSRFTTDFPAELLPETVNAWIARGASRGSRTRRTAN